MLTRHALTDLSRAHENELVLSVYIARDGSDPGNRAGWRLRLAGELESIRSGIERDAPGDLEAFEKASEWMHSGLDTFGRVLPHEGWSAFASAGGLFHSEVLPFAPTDVVRWRQGIYAAPYVRVFKSGRPIVLAVADKWTARLFTYHDGRLSHASDVETARPSMDATDVGAPSRGSSRSGTRGMTRSDYTNRMIDAEARHQLKQATEAILELACDAGGVAIGGMPKTTAAIRKDLEEKLDGRIVDVRDVSLDSSDAELAAAASAAASELTCLRQGRMLEACRETPETGFDLGRIEALPTPADHQPVTFLSEGHGELVREEAARCATCHTQERCVQCHVDADREEITAFPAAPAGAPVPARGAHYNVPAGHTDREFLSTHGVGASRETCATCHTSDDCVTCHVQPVSVAIRALPARVDVVAPGAHVVARVPESHQRMFFSQAHATLAAASDASCATCHTESYCVDCHDAPMQGGYHPTAFLSRHAASAFGRDAECSTCHSTQAFCRECHVEVGLTPAGGGRLGPGYHDGGPLWLLRHGQGARQNLESCASCHRQVDCTQCHGVLGAFKVSPHTLDLDAERAWARSPRTCLACHVGNPLNGN